MELVLECIKAYDQNSRDIKSSGGNVFARLDPASISITFRLPVREEFVEISKEGAQGYFHQNKKTCLNIIARSWLDQPRRGQSQLPKMLRRNIFNEDISDMIILLN